MMNPFKNPYLPPCQRIITLAGRQALLNASSGAGPTANFMSNPDVE